MEENNATASALKQWPGAFGIFKVSREGVRKNIGPLLGLLIGFYAIDIVVSLLLTHLFTNQIIANTFNQIFSLAISTAFTIAFVRIMLASARQKRLELNQSIEMTGSLFWRMFGLEILLILSVFGGFILLVVPGIIIGLRLSLAQYYLVDRDMGVMEAYKASWHATKGHLGMILGVVGVSILMFLPVLTIIGIIATAYLLFMYSASSALIYLYLSKKKNAKTA